MKKTIVFILPQNPYLPELKGYTDYFTDRGFKIIEVSDIKELPNLNYDIEWHFMGIDRIQSKKNIIKIHDYASLSTPPFAKSKDFFKKIISPKPNIRIFLNEKVKAKMNFKDKVPFCYRDMGVNKIFLESNKSKEDKRFDFCYLGNMQKLRQVDRFLIHFKERLKTSSVLMIGEPPLYLLEMFKNVRNIIFTGNVEYLKIPDLLNKCNYGINYVPDFYPFNIQTSTKLLEYCACGLKVISNEYEWVKSFEKKKNASFFYLEENFENFTMQDIEKFGYVTPCMKNHDWDTVIDKSNILQMLNSLPQD